MSDEITIIVFHDLDPADAEASAARINGNGVRMAEMEGFIDRVLLHPEGGVTNKLVTVTRWKSMDAYNNWVAYNRANNPNAGVKAPFDAHPPVILRRFGA